MDSIAFLADALNVLCHTIKLCVSVLVSVIYIAMLFYSSPAYTHI